MEGSLLVGLILIIPLYLFPSFGSGVGKIFGRVFLHAGKLFSRI
jgi:hypothetical protein